MSRRSWFVRRHGVLGCLLIASTALAGEWLDNTLKRIENGDPKLKTINNVTDMVKGSAFVSLVGIVELLFAMKQVIGRVYEPMPIYIVGAMIYFAINYSLSSLSRRLEARYAYIRE